MKYLFKNIYYLFALSIVAFSCNESEDLVTADAKEGGLMAVTNSSLNYVVGNTGPYTMEFFVNQNEDVSIESLTVYKSFVGQEILKDQNDEDSVVTYTSNEILDKEVAITETGNHYMDLSYTFDELIAGLDVSGTTLPTSDGDYIIGDKWTLTFESTLSNGETVTQGFSVNITVSTRFAGVYNVLDKDYFRIGVDRSDLDNDWPATMTIASIDAITYELVEWIGLFDGNTLYFQIDPATGAITYPEEWNGTAQILNDQPVITCEGNPADMVNVPCATSNFAEIKDDGKDILSMAVGYFTDGSGAREFYQLLEKVVE